MYQELQLIVQETYQTNSMKELNGQIDSSQLKIKDNVEAAGHLHLLKYCQSDHAQWEEMQEI